MDGYGNRDRIRVAISNSTSDEVHFHQNTELFYILDGTMDITVKDVSSHLTREDILAVNADIDYRFTAADDILFAKLTIPSSLISSMMQSADIIFWCDSTRRESERYDELRTALRSLLTRYLSVQDHGEDFGYYALCFEVLDILTTHFLLRLTDRENSSDADRFEERIVQINRYIHANYASAISTKDLAKKLYLSQGYLSRFFKKNYGMNFTEYLTGIRLYHALDDIFYTDKPITLVAYDNGFSNATAFNKAFKSRYGQPPSAMRKSVRQKQRDRTKSENETLVEGRLEELLRTDAAAAPAPTIATHVTETCPVDESEPMAASWASTINIGSASDLLRSDVREHILMLAEVHGFTYFRFWNIFSREMLIDPANTNGVYNFSRLDKILDFLVEHNLKPHIELGLKPKRILRNVQSSIVEESTPTTFTSVESWQRFVFAMMDHLRRRYHRRELNTWRIELWFNESQWGDEEAYRNYCELFTASYQTIKQFADELQVGGSGLRTDYVEIADSGKSFLELWRQEPVTPDFISFIVYGYERGQINQDRYSKRSTDNEAIVHGTEDLLRQLKQTGFNDIPVYMTEWNLTVSDRNFINDSCFKGAYIVKNMIDCYGLTDLAAYFNGTDRASEHYDSCGLLHGGCGLISKDDVIKPAGHAFIFLRWLYDHFAGKGANYLVSTDQHGSYGIICHNQKVLNYNYYLTKEDEIQKDALWKYFEDFDPLHLTLTLTGVERGVYQIKTYIINANTGSVINVWQDMNFETELTHNDLRYLIRECAPKMTITTHEVTGDALPLEMELAPNEIRFLRIRRIYQPIPL